MTFSSKTLYSKMANIKSRVCNNWINIVTKAKFRSVLPWNWQNLKVIGYFPSEKDY